MITVSLPWALEEEILCRLPPQSLVKFRSVCKRWNTLFGEKSFTNNNFALARACPPQFIFTTNSNIYSIDIIGLDGADPKIKLRELDCSGIPYRELDLSIMAITCCDELLFSNHWVHYMGSALWNPWLRQFNWLEHEDKKFNVCGVGYDNTRPEKVYKLLGCSICCRGVERVYHERVAIYECASHTFKFIDTPEENFPLTDVTRFSVSLNGNIYWIRPNPLSKPGDFLLRCFDFSREIFKTLCLLPCRKSISNELVLAVFKGDRLSLLWQCFKTRKVDIWVTKKKIDISNNNNGSHHVVWINLLTFPTTNLPCLMNKAVCYDISYFIYDKTTLIMCCGDDETRAACIYIVRADVFKKFQIDDSGVFKCRHCVYAPNFIPVPLGF